MLPISLTLQNSNISSSHIFSNGNPYHNNLHAADVLASSHWIISQTGLKDWMSDLETFSLLMSAIIHDYNHTGTTNNFHIQSTSPLAVVYNDKSVLENHHVAAFFKLVIKVNVSIKSRKIIIY